VAAAGATGSSSVWLTHFMIAVAATAAALTK
jgi:hypothetical protein